MTSNMPVVQTQYSAPLPVALIGRAGPCVHAVTSCCRPSPRSGLIQDLFFHPDYACTLAQFWNLLAGYGGLVSVGQQAFVGIGCLRACSVV